jgi:hypothetical protein
MSKGPADIRVEANIPAALNLLNHLIDNGLSPLSAIATLATAIGVTMSHLDPHLRLCATAITKEMIDRAVKGNLEGPIPEIEVRNPDFNKAVH